MLLGEMARLVYLWFYQSKKFQNRLVSPNLTVCVKVNLVTSTYETTKLVLEFATRYGGIIFLFILCPRGKHTESEDRK